MHNGLIFLLLCVLTIPLGCGRAPSRLARASAPDRLSNQEQLAEIRSTAIPEHYRAQIETRVGAILNTADYRITYGQQPYGSLVCGLLTAPASLGGAAGTQPWLAYFDRQGHLAALHLYPHSRLRLAPLTGEASASAPMPPLDAVEETLLRDCGFR